MTEKIIASSGNVFADWGFNAGEAALLSMRAELIASLRDTIASKGWSQIPTAENLGIGQSRVSDLIRGKREKFNLDMLVSLAMRAGGKIALSVG